MKPPPLLLGATLLFWGWQSQLGFIAIPLAIILESPLWIRWRVVLEDSDFNRLADLSTVLLIGAIVYLISQQSIRGLFTFLNWLPLLFFPLLTAQLYSAVGSIRLSSLMVSLRKMEGKKGIPLSPRLDVSYPYLLLCLLSSSVQQTVWFFPGICLLIAWGLWNNRPRRYSTAIWASFLISALIIGFFSQLGLRRLQLEMEDMIVSWLQWRYQDPYQQETAIGTIGLLKQSEQIVLRVTSDSPLLLREAVYNSYFKTTWRAKQTQFHALTPTEGTTWIFTQPVRFQPLKTLEVSSYLRNGKGLLALPQGTYQIDNLPVETAQQNGLGTVKVEQGPSLITYTAHFTPIREGDSPPTEQDLFIPPDERLLFQTVVSELNLLTKSPPDAIRAVATFFTDNFRYSLDLNRSANQLTPLADFLRSQRSGHCEYFATTTVLLLRAAGIPARYASGYTVEEFSPLENLYLVRKRHAHAWVLAYVEGQWREVDTTPAAWVELEAEQTPWWRGFYDVGSWALYQFSKWRQHDSEGISNWLIGLILPLTLIVIWKVYHRKKVIPSQQPITSSHMEGDWPFYRIIQHFHATGQARLPGETLQNWFKRLQLTLSIEPEIQIMLTLHQRQRFDPLGISKKEFDMLSEQVTTWLKLK